MAEANHEDTDHRQAARETDARKRLLAAGADVLLRAPWLRGNQPPPTAVDLIQFAAWQAGGAGISSLGMNGQGIRGSGLSDADLLAALALLTAARAEVDQVETALLSAARVNGLSWSRISSAMGLRSPQAAQQRFGRVGGRAGGSGAGQGS